MSDSDPGKAPEKGDSGIFAADPLQLERTAETQHGAMVEVDRQKERRAQRAYDGAAPSRSTGLLKFMLWLGAAIALLLLLGYSRQRGWF